MVGGDDEHERDRPKTGETANGTTGEHDGRDGRVRHVAHHLLAELADLVIVLRNSILLPHSLDTVLHGPTLAGLFRTKNSNPEPVSGVFVVMWADVLTDNMSNNIIKCVTRK